ncbi:MAG: GNAT family N-acetyltransferase [Polyangiaceae bacterium]|nr:GNAT family N-acetyltransferase [Polyangiaceae bacterium]
MKPFATLTAAELATLAELTRAHPVFRVYLADARAATASGATNRSARLGADGAGAALGIAFDGMEVRTLIGRLSPAEEATIADLPRPGELHVDGAVASRIARGGNAIGERIRRRVTATRELKYYALAQRGRCAPDARCVPLGSAHLPMVTAFFAAHYPDTIFSPWMLDRPFFGIVEQGQLVACGGVVAAAEGISNVGNFLTAPSARGRGLCRAVAASLAHRLFDQGTSEITLGTTEDNPAACRAYEAIGFRCFDRRVQLDLS